MMQIEELDHKKMEVMKEISDINVLTAKSKAELIQLEKEKEVFLSRRDNEILVRIHKLLNNSRSILEETNSNYTLVHSFYETVKGFSEYISEIHKSLLVQIDDFSEKNELWQAEINEREREISDISKQLYIERESMNREKEAIKNKRAELEKDTKHLESQQASFQTSYKELKKLWEKTK